MLLDINKSRYQRALRKFYVREAYRLLVGGVMYRSDNRAMYIYCDGHISLGKSRLRNDSNIVASIRPDRQAVAMLRRYVTLRGYRLVVANTKEYTSYNAKFD